MTNISLSADMSDRGGDLKPSKSACYTRDRNSSSIVTPVADIT